MINNDFNHLSPAGKNWGDYRQASFCLPVGVHPHGTGFAFFLEVAYGFLMFDVIPQIKSLEDAVIDYKFNGCVGNSSFAFEFEINGYIIRISTLGRPRVTLVINPAKNDVVFDLKLCRR